MNHEDDTQTPLEIPRDLLSDGALDNIMKEFILREGTDYGVSEITFEKKYEQVLRLLDKGDIKIIFDPNTESVTLMTQRDFKRLSTQG